MAIQPLGRWDAGLLTTTAARPSWAASWNPRPASIPRMTMQPAGQMSCSQSVWLEECIRKGLWQRFCRIKAVLVVASYFPGTYHHSAVVNSLFLVIPANLLFTLHTDHLKFTWIAVSEISLHLIIKFIIEIWDDAMELKGMLELDIQTEDVELFFVPSRCFSLNTAK